MNILIRDASYEPLRMAQNATRFKQTSRTADGRPIYQACPPSDPNGSPMRMLDINGDQLTLAIISIVIF